MTASRIKYCPFCHINRETSQDELTDEFKPGVRIREFGWGKTTLYAVMCDVCGTNGPPKPSEAEAIESWNWRGKEPQK